MNKAHTCMCTHMCTQCTCTHKNAAHTRTHVHTHMHTHAHMCTHSAGVGVYVLENCSKVQCDKDRAGWGAGLRQAIPSFVPGEGVQISSCRTMEIQNVCSHVAVVRGLPRPVQLAGLGWRHDFLGFGIEPLSFANPRTNLS